MADGQQDDSSSDDGWERATGPTAGPEHDGWGGSSHAEAAMTDAGGVSSRQTDPWPRSHLESEPTSDNIEDLEAKLERVKAEVRRQAEYYLSEESLSKPDDDAAAVLAASNRWPDQMIAYYGREKKALYGALPDADPKSEPQVVGHYSEDARLDAAAHGASRAPRHALISASSHVRL